MSVERRKLEKLEKILGYYQQNLEILKGRLKEQNRVVAEKQRQVSQLVGKMESTQRAFDATEPSAFDLQLVSHLMATLENEIAQARQELAESNRELDARRAELRGQMSKIDSLEKIVTRTSAEIEHERRKLEQHQSDERYLNTHFTG